MFKNKNAVLRTLLLLVFSAVFLFSLSKIVLILHDYSENKTLYNTFSDAYTITISTAAATPSPTETKTVPITVDFDALKAQNPDVVGWVYCENTPINYPVLQSDDNDYYLQRMINQKSNPAGSIFMDYRSSEDMSSLNTIIYGHNMKNDTMFGTLTDYYNQAYYEAHPVFWYITPTADYEIELLLGYVTDDVSEAYTDFTTAEELTAYLKKAKTKSTFASTSEISDISQIITLSTCSYEHQTARYVVIGKITSINDNK